MAHPSSPCYLRGSGMAVGWLQKLKRLQAQTHHDSEIAAAVTHAANPTTDAFARWL